VRVKLLSWMLVALALVVGCEKGGNNAPSVQDYEQKRAELIKRQEKEGASTVVAQRKAGPAVPAQATSQDGSGLVSGASDYGYDATNKRDPFRSFVLDEAQRLTKHERGPLEQFDLSQLSVVAVVWGTQRPRALVTDPSGRGYVVQEGTPIGKNDGQVIRIGDTTMLVRETYVDYLGAATSKEIELRVRSKVQGG
jgi:type IV pilus assembly protein PilP